MTRETFVTSPKCAKACEKFVELISGRMRDAFTGKNNTVVLDERPSQKFFIGTLCTSSKTGEQIGQKVAPPSIGVEFKIRKADAANGTLTIIPSGAFYYRIFPTLAQQKEEMPKGDIAPLRKVYKKLPISSLPIILKFKDLIPDKEQVFKKECEAMLQATQDAFEADPNKFRKKKAVESKTYRQREVELSVKKEFLDSEAKFNQLLESWDNEVNPQWDFEISCKAAPSENGDYKVKVMFVNKSTQRSSDDRESFIFDAGIHIVTEGAPIVPIQLEYLKDDHKYGGYINVDASGLNCAVAKLNKNELRTEHVPIFKQFRQEKRKEGLTFESLAREPVAALKPIAALMRKEVAKYREDMAKRPIGRDQYAREIQDFEKIIQRFEQGISLITTKSDCLRAFTLMNKTFHEAGKAKNIDEWYLFQIVFVVANIPDIATSEYPEVSSTRELVDVVYAPTGSGKTEAYLGLVVFTMFFDRLRGKHAGVSAITKFPLRLLSLDQLQRIAAIVGKAELVRQGERDLAASTNEPFSVGYFVGERNTPNKLIDVDIRYGKNENVLARIKNDPSEAERFKIVERCPFCDHTGIAIEADEENIRLLHKCTNAACAKVLPIVISDIEIYRYLPTFIVSTLDKIAISGLQKNFRHIFGQVISKCPLHGYTSTNDCTEGRNCSVDKDKFIPVTIKDATPTLLIQDEMHLIRESLGTFDAHYETFLDHYQRTITQPKSKPIKIIAASATISEYKQQAKQLYGRDAQLFPVNPNPRDPFYSMEDKTRMNRLIVGISPHNKALVYAVIEVIQEYHTLIQRYLQEPKRLLQDIPDIGLTLEEINQLLDYYKTMLSYNLAKTEGDRITQSIHTMVNPSLVNKNVQEIAVRSLTGEISFNEVREVLDALQTKDPANRIDLITATNMISHGVDIEKLNFMVFQGMPRNVAEYIQALSRIGRLLPGLAFVILNATKERDQSYFKYFQKFHEYKDLLVEAVPLNRWAKFSIDRTLPGIFAASIFSYFDLKTYPEMKKPLTTTTVFKQAITSGKLNVEEIIAFIEAAYKVSDAETESEHFKKIIRTGVLRFIDKIQQSLRSTFLVEPLDDERPMLSLRDIEEQIDINPTAESYYVMDKIIAAKSKVSQ